MNDAAVAILLVVQEVPIVTGTIWPNLCSFSVSLLAYPLSCVLDAILQDLFTAVLNLTLLSIVGNLLLGKLIVPLEFDQILQFLSNHGVVIV